mgnify:CR=1 FL=1
MKPVISLIFTAGGSADTFHEKLAGQTFKEYEIIEADRFAGIERAWRIYTVRGWLGGLSGEHAGEAA